VAAVTDGVLQRLASALVSRPLVYDLVQNLAGQARVADRLREVVHRLPHERVADIGSAEGGFALRLGVDPVFLDLDPRALGALRRKAPGARAVAADASRLPLPDGRLDMVLCVAVFHHLDDATLAAAVPELARVCSGRLLLLEPLRNDRRRISRWLWRYDRGRHPRTRDDLVASLATHFRVEEQIAFAVYHEYLICVAVPKRISARPGPPR
jgi:ubiquinone/menaquinone biosynthesis C-methylase UbiE